MVLPVSVLFSVFSILFFVSKREQRAKSLLFPLLLIWLALALIATFRPEYMADRGNYIAFWQGWGGERFEIGFATIADVLRRFTVNEYSFLFVFAALSVALKMVAICRMSPLIWASLLIYISNFFILHDMIQMRAAVASGLLLVAVYYVVNRKICQFLLVASFAVLFHYSAILIFPLWFLHTSKCNKWFYIGLIIVSYLFVGIIPITLIGNLIRYIHIEDIELLWYSYEDTLGEYLNIFNAVFLSRILICFSLLLYIQKIALVNKYAVIWVKVYAISLSLFVLLSDFPTAAIRISQLYQIVEILLIPMLLYAFSRILLIGRLMLFCIALFFLLFNIFYNEYL